MSVPSLSASRPARTRASSQPSAHGKSEQPRACPTSGSARRRRAHPRPVLSSVAPTSMKPSPS
eukprot:11391793-Heterocapsa_arctica.AAC.1